MTLWDFWKRWDTRFEVTLTADRRPRGIRVHRASRLHWRDRKRQLGIPVTSPARTALDVAPSLNPAALKRLIKDGLARKILNPDALAEVVRRYPRHPGAAKLRPYLNDRDDTRSVLEDRFLAFCEQAGIPRPRTNAEACGFLVDALFEPEKVIVELDSWDFHSNREAFEDDRDRDGVTTEAGFVTVRITNRRFEAQTDRLLRILAARRGLDSPPS
jgi:hypothetical protein